MTSPADDYADLLRAQLPARSAHSEIALAQRADPAVWIDAQGALFAAITLTTFDPSAPGVPQDIKEQEIYLGDTHKTPPTRLRAYLDGHLRALPSLLERHGADVDTLLPMDVFGYPEALADASLQTAEDFARALDDRERVAAWHAERVRDEWREGLAANGLGDRVDEVRALLVPSIRLHLSAVEASADADDADADADAENTTDAPHDPAARREERPLGITRVGGDPDLPPELPWPGFNGEPLTFVAQLDLASLAKLPAAAELPGSGLLSFFYSPLGALGVRGNPVCVLHLRDTAALTRRAPPHGVERVVEHTAEPAPERMLPPIESPFYEALLPDETQRTFRRSVVAAARGAVGGVVDPLAKIGYVIMQWSDGDTERPVHRVLGYAASIQGDPYVDVEVDAARGGYEAWLDDSDEAIALRRRARRWRLLLQIDAAGDGELLLNQDGGFFYFWIPEDALATHDWSRVRGTLQCH